MLNEIIAILPTLREPVRKILADINLKKAGENNVNELWVDPDKYPAVCDRHFVSGCCVFLHQLFNGINQPDDLSN